VIDCNGGTEGGAVGTKELVSIERNLDGCWLKMVRF
jgi:hypothetical protein